MQKEDMREFAKVIIEETLTHRESIIDEEFDMRYHDVKLLMKNYRKLKAHYADVTDDTLKAEVINTIHLKTGLLMSHVDNMLAAYKVLCERATNPDEARRWDALFLRYIDDRQLNVDEIAETLHVDKRTFFRDISKAMEDMAVLLFGIESIGTWKRKKN